MGPQGRYIGVRGKGKDIAETHVMFRSMTTDDGDTHPVRAPWLRWEGLPRSTRSWLAAAPTHPSERQPP